MIDAMLYADIDLEVKLSDAVTGLKDYKKVGVGAGNSGINAEASAEAGKTSNVVGGLSMT